MLRSRRTNTLVILLLVLLAAMLGALATLQYRWIDRISDVERQQMRANMDFAARRFADDVTHELEPVVGTFEAHEDIVAAHPGLVTAAYEVVRAEDQWMLDDGRDLLPFPPELESVRRNLENTFRDRQRGTAPPPPGPFVADIPALMLLERRPPMFDGPPPMPRIGLILLSRDELRDVIFPRLAQRHFGRESDVAVVVALPNRAEVLYQSNGSFPDEKTPPDAQVILEPISRRGPERGVAGPFRARIRNDDNMRRPAGAQWRLLVRRHDGSVDAIVATARRRNLAVSFGVVLILGAAVLTLAAMLRRAERLRRQQIEFVAAISHELNTPVAALRSAGENLRDGIIHDNDKVARYGETIVREATRLGELTSQVLELAGMREGRARPRTSFDVASIVDDAIAQCRWLVEGTKVHIEANVDRDLPPLVGDANAVTRALQNLIANAIRHGGEGEWVGIRAARDGERVTITVEDRGPGIDPSEATQLFDPFYRGRNSSAVPGAGLGLAIVRQVALAHGGSVRIDKPSHKQQRGASFTLDLPVVTHA
jgi:two-component system sensor histidine kinase SenX3